MPPHRSQAAKSFVVRQVGIQAASKVSRQLSEAARSVGRAAGAIVFASGSAAEQLEAVASAVARAELGCPVLLAAGAGVLTERGEVEGESAAAGLVWSGGEARAFTSERRGEELCVALSTSLRERSRRAPSTALTFMNARGIQPPALEAFHGLERTTVIGGGTVGEAPVFAISAGAEVSAGSGGVLELDGTAPPLHAASPACRLLMPLREITAAQGPMVLGVEGEPALEVLSAAARDLVGQPLVLVALAPQRPGKDGAPPALLIRSVQGVDPSRGGIFVSEEVRVGMRMAFAVRDAPAARADLELRARELARSCAGAAPRFGLYVNCASRGSSLYGTEDVDIRILTARFGQIPIVGVASSFEIAPYSQSPALQLYTGVIGLFTSPS